jgi:hypothetical protein
LGDLLIFRGELGKGEFVLRSILGLQDDVTAFKSDEGGDHLTTLQIGPSANFGGAEIQGCRKKGCH